MHVARSPVSLLISYKSSSGSGKSEKSCLIEVIKDLSPTSFSDRKLSPKSIHLDKPFRFKILSLIDLIGSCHGLLCFERDIFQTYIINPLLGSNNGFVMLPKLNIKVDPSQYCVRAFNVWGFGFCPKTKQYKVIRTIRNTSRVYVYTLGTDDSWRRIIKHHLPRDRVSSELPGVYLNGALHWLTYLKIESDDHRKPRIYCFDLHSERFHQLDHDLLPQLPQRRNELEGFRLGVLDNCLALYIDSLYEFDIWVMKDEKSWAKIRKIYYIPSSSNNWRRVEPLMLTEDGEVLIIYNDEDRLLEYYDVRTGLFLANRSLSRCIDRTYDRYIGHVGTLISPRHLMMKKSTAASKI
ncbi:hypothetical protein COLO4_09937 [Corchorus olitorius]|uniref:F-box associated beta-propeller type 3 domain-containing protein n=1 Tax=Corchorus olitorius TaxID=93759 RepID=A0A1R3KAP2_9ROSI|nr:hypothetical protein COLO4_09937 [Corchorus olitorius]